MKRLFTACVGLALAASATAAATAQATPDVRIIDGEVVQEQITWMANVGGRMPGMCTASMIAPDWVLTATHCLMPGQSMIAVAGKNTYKEGERVKSIKIVSKGDITLMQLEKPYPGVTTVKLPDIGATDPPIGTVADAYGWGLTTQNSNPSDVLKHCTVKVVEHNAKDNRQGPAFITERGSGMAWKGDSGGPLMVNGVQVGVLSMGKTESGKNWYGSVAQARSWIKEQSGV